MSTREPGRRPPRASTAALPTGTVTFLLTDVVGSTRLWDKHPAEMRRALVRHDELIEAEVTRAGGTLVRPRGEGDSRFAVFIRASDAILAASGIQRALAEELWPTPTPLHVRIAVHTGEADLRDGDYYGSAVNRCSRLRGLAEGGQTLVSMATEELVRDSLLRDALAHASLRDLGEHPLRDMERPERVFELLSATLIPGVLPHVHAVSASGRFRAWPLTRMRLGMGVLVALIVVGGVWLVMPWRGVPGPTPIESTPTVAGTLGQLAVAPTVVIATPAPPDSRIEQTRTAEVAAASRAVPARGAELFHLAFSPAGANVAPSAGDPRVEQSRVVDGAVQLTSVNDWAGANVPNLIAGNFVAETRVEVVGGTGRYGIEFHHEPIKALDHRAAVGSAGTVEITLTARVGATVPGKQLFGPFARDVPGIGRPTTFAVSAIGPEIVAYLDGREVARASDATVARGAIAFVAHGRTALGAPPYVVRLSEMRIYAPP